MEAIAFNFDKIYTRRNMDAVKWSNLPNTQSDGFDAIPMHIADMDFCCPNKIIKALEQRARHGFFGYTQRGTLYYNSIIEWIQKRHNYKVEHEWISGVSGVIPSISCAIHAFTEPGDKVIIQTPVYYPFASMIRNNQREVVENRLLYRNGKYFIDFSDLKSKIDSGSKLLILCSPHNPVGRVWSKQELKTLADICLERDILVISDEIHADIVYPGHVHCPVMSISQEMASRTITCMSPSKTFNLAGLTTAYVIIPASDLKERFDSMMYRMGIFQNNIFGMMAMETAYNTCDDWLNELLIYLKKNLCYLKSYIDEQMPFVKLVEPEGTYLAWVNFENIMNLKEEINPYIKENARVILEDGRIFGSGGEHFQRLNFACPRLILETSLERIKKTFA